MEWMVKTSPRALELRVRAPAPRAWERGWGPRGGLDGCKEQKHSSPAKVRTPNRPARSEYTVWYIDTGVSEEPAASILKVELATKGSMFLLNAAPVYRITLRHISENRNHSYRSKGPTSLVVTTLKLRNTKIQQALKSIGGYNTESQHTLIDRLG